MRIITASFMVAVMATAFPPHAADTKLLAPGTAAPSFSLPTLTGQREALSVYCGEQLSKPYVNTVKHVVVLSFWATYCKPCQKEIPQLMQFMKKHQADSIKVFCISIDKEGATIVAPFVKEKGYDVPVLLDPFGTAAARYGVKSLPSLFVLDENAVVRFSASGYEENEAFVEKLESIVTSIRQGKKVTEQGGNVGASVPVAGDKPIVKETPEFTSKEKWVAVARKECGEAPEKIAQDLGITVDELNAWYADLKKAAIALWGKKPVDPK